MCLSHSLLQKVFRQVLGELALIVVTLAVVSSLHGEDLTGDARTLQGMWVAVNAELGGKKFPDQAIETMSLQFHDARYVARLGKEVDRGTYHLDANATPKQLDVTIMKGPNAGKSFLGIYEFKKDLLRICFDLGGKDRPKSFETTDKPQMVSTTYKRKKPKD